MNILFEVFFSVSLRDLYFWAAIAPIAGNIPINSDCEVQSGSFVIQSMSSIIKVTPIAIEKNINSSILPSYFFPAPCVTPSDI